MSGRGRSLVARLLGLTIAASALPLDPVPAAAAAGDIATYAGGLGGAGTATQLTQTPEYVAISGTKVYISDTSVAAVRVVDTTTGRETVVAGNGTFGYSGNGGPATQAQFSHPTGLALDSKGDLFISDTYNNQVREVTPNGIITLVAGRGLGGYSGDGGPATSAQLYMPRGLAIDAHDNLFIADAQNNVIRKLDMTTGIIQTFSSGLLWPSDVVFDPAGDLLIMDSANARVIKVLPSGGSGPTIAGGGTTFCTNCPALSTNLFDATGIGVDGAGNLLIANTYYNVIQKVDKLDGTGTITTLAGNGLSAFGGDGGPATSAQLYNPFAVRANPAGGFFIADKGNERVRKVDGSGTITTIAGTGGCGYAGDGGPAVQAQLCGPRGVALDATGSLLIADADGNRIRKVDASGTITTLAGNGTAGSSGDGGPATQAQLSVPQGVAVDAAGDLFIADSTNNVVREITPDAVIHTYAGNHTSGYSGDQGPATQAALNNPTGVGFDATGNLLVADYSNHRIRSVDHVTKIITTVAGTGVRGFSGDGGKATLAQFNFPSGVAVDGAGNVFIADSGNNKIRMVDSSGNINTVVGAGSLGDGSPAINAGLNWPFAVAIGPKNILYIDDTFNQRIRMVTPDGIIHTAAGTTQGFTGDGGPATAATLNYPYGVAVDSAGNIFIGDTWNRRVRRVEAFSVPAAPTNVVATGVSGGATVTWSAPADGGGMPITSYTVTPYQGTTAGTPTTIHGTPPPSSAVLTGLVRFQTYTFVVTATTALGTGPPSQASNAVTVYMAPTAPGGTHAVAGISSAQLSWTVPLDNGGTAIVSYLVTPYQGSTRLAGLTVTGSPPPTSVLVPGLSNGTFFTFTVAATNAVGTGNPSAPSNAVRPMEGGSYHPLPPARILDTRDGLGSVRAPLASGESRPIQVVGQGGVPPTGVSAVVLNVAVTNTTGGGYLTVYPSGITRPTAANLNWASGETVSNLVEVEVGIRGYVNIYAYGSSADVIFDVQGWVGVPANSGGADGLFNGLPPARILDTRDGTGGTNHRLGPGSTLTLRVTGSLTHDGVPSGVPASGVSAAVLNLAITNPSQSSYLTVYPTGTTPPLASNLNFAADETIANRVVARLGSGGMITIFNAAGNVDVIADVNGWVTDSSNAAGGTDFTGLRPTRILDTRSPSWGQGPLQAGYIYAIQLRDANGNPLTGVSAIVIVSPRPTLPRRDISRCGRTPARRQHRRTHPTFNFRAGQTIPNLVVLQLGANATFDIYNPAGETDVVMDILGFLWHAGRGSPHGHHHASVLTGSAPQRRSLAPPRPVMSWRTGCSQAFVPTQKLEL